MESKLLTVDEIKELVKNASPVERKYLLELKLEKYECRAMYEDVLRIIYGSAEVIELSKSLDDCLEKKELLIIPKTVPVVAIVEHYDEDPNVRESTDIYIFDLKEGWKKIKVYR